MQAVSFNQYVQSYPGAGDPHDPKLVGRQGQRFRRQVQLGNLAGSVDAGGGAYGISSCMIELYAPVPTTASKCSGLEDVSH